MAQKRLTTQFERPIRRIIAGQTPPVAVAPVRTIACRSLYATDDLSFLDYNPCSISVSIASTCDPCCPSLASRGIDSSVSDQFAILTLASADLAMAR